MPRLALLTVVFVLSGVAIMYRLRLSTVFAGDLLPARRLRQCERTVQERERAYAACDLGDVSDFILIVELIRVAFAQGASVPACLVEVGRACDGAESGGRANTGSGSRMRRRTGVPSLGQDGESPLTAIGESLRRGLPWEQAWRVGGAGREMSGAREKRERGGSGFGQKQKGYGGRDDPDFQGRSARRRKHLAALRRALEPSWKEGSAPLGRLESLAQSALADQEVGIELEASKLGVRLLLPTGLCFLPAFILLGVIPCIAAFAGGFA